MKIARLSTPTGTDFAVSASGGGWAALRQVGLSYHGLPELLQDLDNVRESVDIATDLIPFDEADLQCPVVRPGKILGIGLNYLDHIGEARLERPDRPLMFAKFPSAMVGPYDDVVVDATTTEMADWEVELGVVIGSPTRRVDESEAMDAVAGYVVANDITARDSQFRDGQFSRSKSFDTFCPIGPWITTADEVPDPQSLRLKTTINGATLQDSSTEHMLFPISYLIHYLSQTMTLEPGDVILTGTPQGVGMGMVPPRYLQPGDVVSCEIAGLGSISNPVVGSR